MKNLNKKIGLIVKNNVESLKQTLGLKNIKLKSEHIYAGQMNKHLALIITTEPVDKEGKEIRISNIKIDISTFKMEIVYEAVKGDEVIEVFIEMRYLETNMKK